MEGELPTVQEANLEELAGSKLSSQKEFPNHVFDIGFFDNTRHYRGLDDGDAVAFKLIDPRGIEKDMYLVLFNCHNGYYGHGFEFRIGSNVIQEGTL